MNTKFSKMKSGLLICLIVLALYVLAFMLIPFAKTPTAWVVFGFTTLAIVTAVVVAAKAFANTELKDLIFAYPIFRLGLWLAGLQLGIGALICLIDAIWGVAVWVAIVVSALLFGIMIVGVILASTARKMVVAVEEQTKEKIKTVTFFRVDVRNLKNLCEKDDVLLVLSDLADCFEYSDPVSNEATAELEEQIRNELAVLRDMLPVEESEPLIAKVKQIKNMLLHRNDVCKASK